MTSQIIFSKSLPVHNQFPDETIVLYDSILDKNKNFNNWINKFSYKISLKAGEELKTLKSFNLVLNKISALEIPKSTSLTFVAVGGGSVGDFVGFLASVYLRGRALILIPSTWLSAVDSAHGGKNGLNFSGIKNQIGTFYPAQKIYICKNLLLIQPSIRLIESLGEIIKISIISDLLLFNKLEKNISAKEVYKNLPKIIDLKNKIINKDPLEKNGFRRVLNLGHTLGHVFESHYKWPHGIAVILGIQFSARWSLNRKFLKLDEFIKISMLIESLEIKQNLKYALGNIDEKKIIKILLKDKKLTTKNELDFIFIKKIGNCFRKSITIEQILLEVKRQLLEY